MLKVRFTPIRFGQDRPEEISGFTTVNYLRLISVKWFVNNCEPTVETVIFVDKNVLLLNKSFLLRVSIIVLLGKHKDDS